MRGGEFRGTEEEERRKEEGTETGREQDAAPLPKRTERADVL